ncbi:MAG: hypothetical protein LIP77_04670 [Planctomycetes bacterium]|nr:hypothetical protein [Planctomycetota bacterium]
MAARVELTIHSPSPAQYLAAGYHDLVASLRGPEGFTWSVTVVRPNGLEQTYHGAHPLAEEAMARFPIVLPGRHTLTVTVRQGTEAYVSALEVQGVLRGPQVHLDPLVTAPEEWITVPRRVQGCLTAGDAPLATVDWTLRAVAVEGHAVILAGGRGAPADGVFATLDPRTIPSSREYQFRLEATDPAGLTATACQAGAVDGHPPLVSDVLYRVEGQCFLACVMASDDLTSCRCLWTNIDGGGLACPCNTYAGVNLHDAPDPIEQWYRLSVYDEAGNTVHPGMLQVAKRDGRVSGAFHPGLTAPPPAVGPAGEGRADREMG